MSEKHTVVVVPLTVEEKSARVNRDSIDQQTGMGTFGHHSEPECVHAEHREKKCKGGKDKHGGKKDKCEKKKYKKFLKHKFKHIPDCFTPSPFDHHHRPGHDMFGFVRPPFQGHMTRGRGHWRGFPNIFRGCYHGHVGHGPWGAGQNPETPFTVDLREFQAEEISVTVEEGFLVVHAQHEPRQHETGNPSRDVTVRYDVTDRSTEGIRSTLREDGVLEVCLPEVKDNEGTARTSTSSSSEDDIDGRKMDEDC